MYKSKIDYFNNSVIVVMEYIFAKQLFLELNK